VGEIKMEKEERSGENIFKEIMAAKQTPKI